MASLKDQITNCLKFNKKETKGLIITALVMGFIASFREWGVEKASLVVGLNNFIAATFIVMVAIIAHLGAQRFIGQKWGYKLDYEPWTLGLILGLILVFLSDGIILFLPIGGVVLHQIARRRVGLFRGNMRHSDLGWVTFFGPLTNLILAIILKAFAFLPNNLLIEKAIAINLWIALFSMLPIPPMTGSKVFFASRSLYLTSAFTFLIIAFLLQTGATLIAVLGSIFVMSIFFLLFKIIIFGKWH